MHVYRRLRRLRKRAMEPYASWALRAAYCPDLRFTPAAHRRAFRCFWSKLTPHQRWQALWRGEVRVGRWYWLRLTSGHYNVRLRWGGTGYCCYPRSPMPLADVWVHQKLYLEVDGRSYLRMACHD